jgi:hypothetical protein
MAVNLSSLDLFVTFCVKAKSGRTVFFFRTFLKKVLQKSNSIIALLCPFVTRDIHLFAKNKSPPDSYREYRRSRP